MARPAADRDHQGDNVTDNDVQLSYAELRIMLADRQAERDRLRREVAELRDALTAMNAELPRLREQITQLRTRPASTA